MAKPIPENCLLPKSEYYNLVKTILNHPEFLKRKEYVHHESCSVYEHCLMVSYYSYLLAKKWNLDYHSAAIGGLLHDFYDKPWQTADHKAIEKKKTKFFKQHGFVHAGQAVKNAYLYFPQLMNNRIENIIKRHMFPLNIHPPRYKESWIVTMVDKYVSLDVFKSPKEWLKYIGLARPKRKK